VVDKVENLKLCRGKAGEIMRVAVCRLIECIAIAEIKLDQAKLKSYMVNLFK
jgi:hypothetical protein